jgi:uncharacterized protein (DUF2147 family)
MNRRLVKTSRSWAAHMVVSGIMQFSVIGSLLALILLFSGHSLSQVPKAAAENSPVGRWKTVDDATGKVKSIVVTWEENGRLYGKIEKLINPEDPQNPDPRCVHCQGELKGKPLIGLRILWDLTKSGEQWSGGKVLDPHNGKEYKCSVTVEDGGKKLKVRGYIGFSMLGRTQYWLRDE